MATDLLRESKRVAPLVAGERLAFARQLKGWTQRDLVAELARAGFTISAPALSQLERGHSRPSVETLAALCKVHGCPPTFFLERPGDERRPGFFRNLASTPARQRNRYVAQARLLWSFVHVMEDHVVLPEMNLPIRTVDPDDWQATESEAARLRSEWGVPAGPIQNVVRLMERNGIVVIRPKNFQREVDAFSVRYDDRSLVVLSAGKNLASRSRFDAAHELGHLLMHEDRLAGSAEVERHAHRFAAAFLMPAEDIRAELPSTVDLPTLIDLKVKWRVSMSALLMRAKTLDVMSPPTYVNAMKMFSARGWRKAEPGDDLLGPIEIPRMLDRALELIQEEEGLTVRALCDEGSLPYRQVEELIFQTKSSRPVVVI